MFLIKKLVKGVKLVGNVLHVQSINFPFDFIVKARDGLDPFLLNDFSDDRCTLYLQELVDMERVRSVPVEV